MKNSNRRARTMDRLAQFESDEELIAKAKPYDRILFDRLLAEQTARPHDPGDFILHVSARCPALPWWRRLSEITGCTSFQILGYHVVEEESFAPDHFEIRPRMLS